MGIPRLLPIRWLPLGVQRYREADLDTAAAAAPTPTTPAPKDTGTGLKIAGSKTIKVGVGGDGGVALNQTLLLTADGELAPGVHLKARLADGDMPLSAQGSSAALREVDEIFLELESPRWRLRLGDQPWKVDSGLAPGIERRLRGLAVGWKHPLASVSATLGGSQAIWKRVAFAGTEGRQEGYALALSQGFGVVVPGSEKVRVNGELMRRGPDADYLIRYTEGLLDFTTRRRISASDRIEVEFQSADLDYERSLAGAQAKGRIGPWRWETYAVRESDDASRPLGYVPDTSTRRILREAGSDALLARTADGQFLKLPTQTGEAGLRLFLGDSANWIATDLRESDHDPNTVSGRNTRHGGFFGSASTGWRRGQFVTRGGLGRLGLELRGDRLDARFHGLSSPDSLGSQSDGFWAPTPGSRTSGAAKVRWDLAPGIGIRTETAARSDALGWTTRHQTTLGVDQGPKQILSSWEWIRLDAGEKPLEQTRAQGLVAWPLGTFTPSLQANAETRDERFLEGWREVASLALVGGGRWHPTPEVEFEGLGNTRRDALRPTALAALVDTARSLGGSGKLRWTPFLGDLNLEMNWKQLQTRPQPALAWVQSSNWLGSASAGFWPTPGVRSQATWKLTSSSYQSEIPSYDTVPAGTGNFRYDTLLHIVLPSDEGDLRLAGTRLDTSRAPVLATQRSASVELELEPGKLFPRLGGVLADLGARAHAEWEATDSRAATRIWPQTTDADLAKAITGRSNLSLQAWWTRGRNRLDFETTRNFVVQAAPIVSRLRDLAQRLQWSSASASGHRLLLIGAHGDLRDQQDRLRLESFWSTDPSLALRLTKRWELRPGWASKWARGSDGPDAFVAQLQAPYATLRASLPHNLNMIAELRRVTSTADALAGFRLTDGYPDGITWRASSSLDWTWKEHVLAHAEWVARKEPTRPWFQKLSCEAKAVF